MREFRSYKSINAAGREVNRFTNHDDLELFLQLSDFLRFSLVGFYQSTRGERFVRKLS